MFLIRKATKMSRKKDIPSENRSLIIFYINLMNPKAKFRNSIGTIQNAIKYFRETGSYHRRKPTGRPRVTAKYEDMALIHSSMRDR